MIATCHLLLILGNTQNDHYINLPKIDLIEYNPSPANTSLLYYCVTKNYFFKIEIINVDFDELIGDLLRVLICQYKVVIANSILLREIIGK